MKERERNKRFLSLLIRLTDEKRFSDIELLESMVLKDTEAMQKSFEIITKGKIKWISK